MKVQLNNAQSGGPCINILDDNDYILVHIAVCSDDIMIGEKCLSDFPEEDGIVIYED